MATEGRRNAHDLIAELKEKPYRFQFFQAMRLLQLEEKAAGRPTRKLRFRTPATLGFPASEISRFEPRAQTSSPTETREAGAPEAEQTPYEMEVNFLGLTGPSGVLPSCYTELLIERRFAFKDQAAHQFLDLFNHRMTSLFFQAWEKHHFFASYEKGQRDGFTSHLLDLLGSGKPQTLHPSQKGRGTESPVPAQFLAYFAGALGRRPLPSAHLVSILSTYFETPVSLEQFVGQWIEASAEDQSGIGNGNCALGTSTFLGARMWDQQTKIRLRIGPLSKEKFSEFQPGRPAAAALRFLAGICLGQSLNCDVTLVLSKDARMESTMSADADPPMCLGMNMWMQTKPSDKELDDVCFKLL